ncbi:MAG: hypothetical protein JWN15_1913 [Firmicutes bacterium]|nr:hypothetical protein [Bacillota bacterium]
MTDRSRLELFRQAGLAAWQGLKAIATGIDVVVEPESGSESESGSGSGSEPGSESESDSQAGPAQSQSEAIGTAIGRRAMAAAEHRVGAAEGGAAGSAVTAVELLANIPLTLAVYPGPAVPLVERALTLTGAPLPVDGDLEIAATSRDLAWLPLDMGRVYYARFPGGRMLATGGYRRAALVRLEAGAGAWPGTWCALGEDALAAGMPNPPDLVLERPEALWRAMAQGQVRQALLGGELLERALALPGAAVVLALVPGAGVAVLPLWGLFSSGRTPVFSGAADEHLVVTAIDSKQNQADS